jgi:hypothetical protein
MTQETLDMVVHAYCEGCQEFIGDYELVRYNLECTKLCAIQVKHNDIENVYLPWEYIKNSYTPKEQSKTIIELVKEVIENGDQWLQDEKDYHADKLAEMWDDDRKNELEND